MNSTPAIQTQQFAVFRNFLRHVHRPALCQLVVTLALGCSFAAAQTPDVRLNNVIAYQLVEHSTGTIVKSYQENIRTGPASLAKLMTAYVLAEVIATGAISYDQSVTISNNAWRIPGSTMFLEVGDKLSVEQLALGLIVQSGNDASIAVAELVAGDAQSFVTHMNNTAARLGMRNTAYTNPSGLPTPQQYTTAADTAILARALIANFPDFYQRFFAVREYTYRNIKQLNRNRLLWQQGDGYDGIKTGHTKEDGYHIVVSAQRDGVRYIGVVMGAASERQRVSEARKMVDWGFRYYQLYRIYEPHTELARSRVWMGDTKEVGVGPDSPVVMVLSRENSHKIAAKLQLLQYQRAPIGAGADMGQLVISLDGKELKTSPLVALGDVHKGGLMHRILDWSKLQLLKFNE